MSKHERDFGKSEVLQQGSVWTCMHRRRLFEDMIEMAGPCVCDEDITAMIHAL